MSIHLTLLLDCAQERDQHFGGSGSNREASSHPLPEFSSYFPPPRVSRRKRQACDDMCYLSSQQVFDDLLRSLCRLGCVGSRDSNNDVVVFNHSCRTETLSTLRFAQRAKAIQNKAVVNEETGNDVNLLREQIRQLKVRVELNVEKFLS